MRVVIQDNYEKMSEWAANYIADKINNHKEERPFILGLPTGSSPIGVYKELIEMNKAGKVSFANVVTFNMDEYLGLPKEHDQSYWYFMHDNFFDHLVDMKPEIPHRRPRPHHRHPHRQLPVLRERSGSSPRTGTVRRRRYGH